MNAAVWMDFCFLLNLMKTRKTAEILLGLVLLVLFCYRNVKFALNSIDKVHMRHMCLCFFEMCFRTGIYSIFCFGLHISPRSTFSRSLCSSYSSFEHGPHWVVGCHLFSCGCCGINALGNVVRVYPEIVQGLTFYRSKI